MKKNALFVLFCLIFLGANAQISDSLQEVVLQAFQSKDVNKNVAASVGILSTQKVQQTTPTSLVTGFNCLPGVRLEERSPGSYRLSIRGSLLRSPFGVRNVKVYWNDFPLSDAGSNTYLNLLDIAQISSIEISKGPAASMYGVGNNGVVLLQSPVHFSLVNKHSYQAGILGGAYGLLKQNAAITLQTPKNAVCIQQIHQQCDGYRQQSAMRRDIVSVNGAVVFAQHQFSYLAFYSNLYYQTPGGITLQQMQQNAQLARTAVGAIPGAIQQQAAIYNKAWFLGLRDYYQLNPHFSSEIAVFAGQSKFTNPAILNFEQRTENNWGARGKLVYETLLHQTVLQWVTGGEWLYNHSLINDYGNRNGNADTVQFKDAVFASQAFGFTQLKLSRKKWNVTVGISVNNQAYRYKRLTDSLATQYRTTDAAIVVMPRLAGLYQICPHISVYGLVAKGFSPPSLAEIHPTDGNFYPHLQPEQGWNIEGGFKGNLLQQHLQFCINVYRFLLENTIVSRSNAASAGYFTNAGSTRQNGLEAAVQYHIMPHSKWLQHAECWGSYSYQPYHFIDYQKDGKNYSGNALIGVPAHVAVFGLNVVSKNGFYINISNNITAAIPLNDANDAIAPAYHLLQAKLGFNTHLHKVNAQFFVGGDNLLNQTYSLGNDINAAGKRYYNPASPINCYAGFGFSW